MAVLKTNFVNNIGSLLLVGLRVSVINSLFVSAWEGLSCYTIS